MMWDYEQPVDIRFGNGRVSEIGELARERGLRNGMLITSGHFVRDGFAQRLIDDSAGALTGMFSDFSPNPDVSEVDACAAVMRESGTGFVVAMGGGSAMDLAKAAASICLTEDSIADYHGTGKAMPQEHLPLIAVPTTAGTGSEVTCVSVLTNRALGKKAPIVSDGFFPDLAIVDPELTYSVPPYVTACTGMDVLSQAIEGYWSKGHQPICDACAVHAAKLVFRWLPVAVAEPRNAEAREKMCEASVIAGLAFTLPKTTSSHACSFPLTNIHGIPHGEACGLTLDWFARINADAQHGRVQEFARMLGFADVDAMADAIHDLKVTIGMRTGLKDLALSESQIDDLVRISRHPNLYNNPVDITDEMLRDMYEYLAATD
ncbi:iron-containing alcohol dehydrogenase [Bifidobacterium sp. SMB2]|uniref:Iron-containing alcohol dehydrogenase n=1 Tax=Bifidobacterium saimiriisciurei TaxID=2661627 RepID=A0ABX0C9A0_9BIFI|nr:MULTISPECIES: iron-containing alcohol dehydrogenase family protein [Bifidobacterium]NEG95549.1 iron-containing alcohol dehydrogenase [Bifidobacterium sp. SMB2]NEH11707.1 iron-containing alcohol dehydrogenase [Bifidobacterium saimiriisciurei]